MEFSSGHIFRICTHNYPKHSTTYTHTPLSLEVVLVLDTTASQPRESGVGVGAHMYELVLREELRSEFEMNEIRSCKRETENHQQQKTRSSQCM